VTHDATFSVLLESQNKFQIRIFCPYNDRTGSNVRSTVMVAFFISDNA